LEQTFFLNQFSGALDNTGLLNNQTTNSLLFKPEVMPTKSQTLPLIHFFAFSLCMVKEENDKFKEQFVEIARRRCKDNI
jgi:hypothetical protein